METDFNYIDCIEKVKQHDDSASESLYRFTFPIAQKQVAFFVHNRPGPGRSSSNYIYQNF